MTFAVGVDLGGTNLRVAAVRENGELLERVTTGTKVSRSRDAVIDEMTAAIRRLSSTYGANERLVGVGIGVPGILDAHSGTLRESPNLPGWSDYPVRAEIERRLGHRVVLENDANAAAMGEAWLGSARHAHSMAIITLGTGIGGGMVTYGKAWQGSRGMAGEFGHIVIDPEGPRCNCGNRGCAEQFASATAVVRMAREMAERGEAPALARAIAQQSVAFCSRRVHDFAIAGDGPAQAIFGKVGWALGILLSDLINALNLEVYVIGGGVAAAWDAFAPQMFAELRRRSFIYKATAPEDTETWLNGAAPAAATEAPRTMVVRAALGSDAGLYGAARLALEI